jgi:hypothetical protein
VGTDAEEKSSVARGKGKAGRSEKQAGLNFPSPEFLGPFFLQEATSIMFTNDW